MLKDKYIFAQLVKFLDNNKSRHLVDKYDGDKYVKSYTCWNQLLAMMFGLLSNRESLRDLIVALDAHFGNLYTINRIGAFFVVRAKTNVRFKPETWKRRLPENVVSDAIGYFTVYKSAKDYPEKLRKVVCIGPEDGTRYILLTDNLAASAETIADLYRNRWSVGLFFKWIKQHLRINKFWGTSENVVRIQIYCATIIYYLVAIVQHDMELERSIYEILQILGISLTDKTNLRDIFDKSNFKNINVLCDSSEPNLFNF